MAISSENKKFIGYLPPISVGQLVPGSDTELNMTNDSNKLQKKTSKKMKNETN